MKANRTKPESQDLYTVADKEPIRQDLNKDIEEFLKNGGKITVVPNNAHNNFSNVVDDSDNDFEFDKIGDPLLFHTTPEDDEHVF